MAEYSVRHLTHYTYEKPVAHCLNLAHLCPDSNDRQICRELRITVEPKPKLTEFRRDYFGNTVYSFSVDEPHTVLSVLAEAKVSTNSVPTRFSNSPTGYEVLRSLNDCSTKEEMEALEFIGDSLFVLRSEVYSEFLNRFLPLNKPYLEAVLEYVMRFREEFKFKAGSTNIYTPLEEVLDKKEGVCQDFTHLSIAAFRSMGFPCRYVSGYIETYPPPGKPKLRGSDATHAWISVYCPGLGWFDFDPTNGKSITEEYIYTSLGRDFSDVSPLRGILFGGGKHKLKVEVDVIQSGGSEG
ncbi:bacterial transglutaminase-like protein [Leptospira inadai serovar Lyme str. 10]|uniref:Bacterial transglutaminase-like protein n=3 Tax=Leptospira inadai serovar Lyme TaxID=293084 RepID=V6HCV8_9LEPT|nr:transglutaminase family protein [Leptospira inadai]EQA37557.1 bacterial transglutaminase-like protein [Leptospira inadai serovar Lyme str. 10]PNV75103.1 cysteine protease [Leptospira inadai serovar Lyme]